MTSRDRKRIAKLWDAVHDNLVGDFKLAGSPASRLPDILRDIRAIQSLGTDPIALDAGVDHDTHSRENPRVVAKHN